jgi:hypothetical protein
LAHNRYGWQKRAKELARKQKSDDKMKRRQGKTPGPQSEMIPAVEAAPPAGGAATDPSRPD